MKFTDSNLRNILKNGITYLPDREIYIFSDIISLNNEMMDKLFHLDFEVDDYYYKWLSYCFDAIYESMYDENINLEDIDFDALRDDIFSSLEADSYTSDLTTWLNSRPADRVCRISEVLEEGLGIEDGFQLLAYAQLKEKEEVYAIGIEFMKWLCEKEIEEVNWV